MIVSLTKNKQSEAIIRKMTAKFFAPVEMAGYTELTEGYFNVAYEIFLRDGRSVILKVAPAKDVRIMTYEKNIMQSEVNAMRMVENYSNIPAPKVLGYDDSCTVCPSPYFFMEKLPGKSLNAVKDALSAEQLAEIYTESGRINRRINEITCPCFGYPGQPEFQGKTWFPVFRKMLEAGIQDAENGGVDLKISPDALLACLNRDKALFDEVTEPKLVHWDCWDGNIFVEKGKITGFIDWERSIWGDPLLEVGFRTYSENTAFLKGYGAELTENQKRRALWYGVYLMLLVSLECEYRKYETMDMYYWGISTLQKQLAALQMTGSAAECRKRTAE